MLRICANCEPAFAKLSVRKISGHRCLCPFLFHGSWVVLNVVGVCRGRLIHLSTALVRGLLCMMWMIRGSKFIRDFASRYRYFRANKLQDRALQIAPQWSHTAVRSGAFLTSFAFAVWQTQLADDTRLGFSSLSVCGANLTSHIGINLHLLFVEIVWPQIALSFQKRAFFIGSLRHARWHDGVPFPATGNI